MRLFRDGQEIRTVEEWYQYAPPRGGLKQWRNGYSAKEIAKAWCRTPGQPAPPAEFSDALAVLPGYQEVRVELGLPEHRIAFDGVPGEPRNADLVLSCSSLQGPVAVSVEAKSRETFGDPVYQAVAEASRKFCEEISTNAIVRLHGLVRGLMGPREPGAPRIGELRYQLLTATAGALLAARQTNAVVAVLVIHEFRPTNVGSSRYADNARDLTQFVHRLGGTPPADDRIWWGPFMVPGNDHIPRGLPLFIGKVVSPCDRTDPLSNHRDT
jgi:hypothetical protein